MRGALFFTALVALRFDGHLEAAPWPVLFVPLWMADPVMLFVVALVVAEGPGQLWPAVYRLLPPFVLQLAFQALLCVRLHDARLVPWLAVWSPLLIGRGADLAALISGVLCPRRGAPRLACSAAPYPRGRWPRPPGARRRPAPPGPPRARSCRGASGPSPGHRPQRNRPRSPGTEPCRLPCRGSSGP